MTYYAVQHAKVTDVKMPNRNKFWGDEHENGIKNRELALVSNLLKGYQKNELALSERAERSAPRWRATALAVTFSIPRYQLTLLDRSFLAMELYEPFRVLGSCVTCSACALFAVTHTFLSDFVSHGIEMPCMCTVQITSVVVCMWRNRICFKEAHFNSSDKMSLLPLLVAK